MINTGDFNKIFQVSATPSLVLHADAPVFTIAEVNQAFLKLTNSSRDDLLNRGIFEVFPENREHTFANSLLNLRQSLDEVLSTGLAHKMSALRYDLENRDKNSYEEKYWEAENIPVFADDGSIAYIINTAIDITPLVLEQKNHVLLKQDMSNGALGLQRLEKSSQTGRWEFVPETGELYWSDEFFRICGYEPQSFLPTVEMALQVTHPDDRELTRTTYEEAVATGDEYRLEKRVLRPDGKIVFVLSTGKIIRNTGGKVVRLIGLYQDISRQKEEEYHLKLLESVITNTKDAVVITEAEPTDEQGRRIIYVNAAFTAMTGYIAVEVIGKTPRILQGPRSDKAALKMLGEALRKWQPGELTIINYKKSGEPFWINFSVTPVANEKGYFTHWIAVERDVSEQKLAEESLMQATRLYAFISQINQTIIHAKNERTLFDEVCRIVVEQGKFKLSWIGIANTKLRKINLVAGAGANGQDTAIFSDYNYDAGGPIDKVLSGSDFAVVNDIEEQKQLSLYQYAIGRGIHSGIALAIKKSGKVVGAFSIYATEKNIFNKAEIDLLLEVTGNISFALDIFENEVLRTQSEQDLRKSEKRLKEAQALAKIGSWETELPELNVHWSEETHRIFETDPYLFEPTHSKFLDFIPLADRSRVADAFLHSLHKESPDFIEHRIITAKGREKVVIERWQVFHGELGLPVRAIGTCQDITEAKAAEWKLQQSEFRYRQIVETAQEGIWLADEHRRTIFVNRKMGLILEYEPEEMIGKDVLLFMDETEKQNAVAAIDRRKRGVVEQLERSYITKSGRKVRTNISASPIYDEEGQYKGSLAMVADITERKMAEEKLEALNKGIEESEKRYSNLFHGSPQPMWVFDPRTFIFQQVNKAAIAHYGYSEEEFLKMTIMDIRPADETAGIKVLIKENLAKHISPYAGRFRHVKKSGEIIIVEVYSSSVTIREKIYRSVIAIDVTESIQFEHKITSAIIRAQEEERYEIGTELHDNVCQILSTSLLNLSMLREAVPLAGGQQWYEQCKKNIMLASDEIRNLSHQLAPAFFDEITLEDTFWVLLNSFNGAGKYQLLVHFDQALKKEVTLSRDMQLNLFRILQEQLRNILKHASASRIEIKLSLQYNALVMTVADDGLGFDPATVKKGIGIANMKRRAELFSGKLNIHSSPGRGCEIVVVIPLEA